MGRKDEVVTIEPELAREVAATWEPIDSIFPWSKNPRKISDEQVDRIAKSITRFDFSSTVTCRAQDRRIIAGHGRLLAAKKLGMTQIPVRFVALDEAQAAALALADNKLTEITPWDEDVLADVLRDLEVAQVDLDGLGWSGDELELLLGVRADDADGDPFADLPDGEPPFRTITFTLTPEQLESVQSAMADAIKAGPFVDTGNDNKNGNALARIAEAYRG